MSGSMEPVMITGLDSDSRMNDSADAAYDMVSVPMITTNASKSWYAASIASAMRTQSSGPRSAESSSGSSSNSATPGISRRWNSGIARMRSAR